MVTASYHNTVPSHDSATIFVQYPRIYAEDTESVFALSSLSQNIDLEFLSHTFMRAQEVTGVAACITRLTLAC
jgi:hypothetical protein